MQKDKVIIIGAGIAGLSLAIQLAENKIACIVLEGRHNFDGVTSGVRISTQGVRILEKMQIRNVGANTQRTIMHYGSIVADFALNNSAGTSPAIMVTRLAVYEKLMERVKFLSVEVIMGFKLLNAIEHPDGVEVISEAGQKINGKFLVGADGVGSTVRKILNPGLGSGKLFAGYVGVGLLAPDDTKIEMSLYNTVGGTVGVASIGKVNSTGTKNNVFFWTHLHMPEEEAKKLTNEVVVERLNDISKDWRKDLREQFETYSTNPEKLVAFGPVYNGKAPASWYSDRMIIIGDAAHPYGPGGQGISMALKDSEALCDIFVSGMSEEKRANFQKIRSEESKSLGEAAEARNSPENHLKSHWAIFSRGVLMKFYHLFNRGVLKSF